MLNPKPMISLILAAGFISAPAIAQNSTASPAEQKAARAEIEQLTKRIEQLSKQLGPDTNLKITIIERSVDGDNTTVERRVISNSADGKTMARSEGGPRHMDGAPRIGLGIVMAPNAEGNGVRVAAVSPNGPAKTAGIQSGDVITSINGKTLSAKSQAGLDQARAALANLKDGQSVKVVYNRTDKSTSTTVKAGMIEPQMVINRDTRRLGPGGAPPAMAHATRWNGLNMAPLNAELGRYFGTNNGVLVLGPNPELPQLKGGDVITKVDGKVVSSSRDVLNAMRGKKPGDKVPMQILRDRKSQSISITAPKERSFNVPAPPRPPAPQAAPGTPAPPAPPPPPRTAFFIDDEGDSYAFIEEVFSDSADFGALGSNHEIEIIEWDSINEP